MAFNYSPKIVTDGLILYLDAANPRSYTSGSGTTWTDISRIGTNGTLVNGPTFSSANGGSIVFDGTNDYVDLGGSLNLKPTTAITVSTWIRFNAMVADVRALSDWHQNGATDRWIFYITNSNTIQWYLLTNSFASAVPFSPVLLNTWYNFTGVYNGISQIFYVNGVFHNSTPKTGNMNTSNTSQPVRLGGQVSAGGYHNGNISTTLIYNRALSATEILQNYNTTKTRFGL